MQLFYILNIILYFAASVALALYLTRYFKLPFSNPLTIPVFISVPIGFVTSFSGPFFALQDGWFNPYFQYALLVDNTHSLLGTLAVIVLVRYFTRKGFFNRWLRRVEATGSRVQPSRMCVLAAFFAGVFLASFLLLTREMGLVNWLLDPRTGYQLFRTGNGQWYALCVLSLSFSIVLMTIYARSSAAVLLLSFAYLAAVFFLGNKGFLVTFAIYLIVILGIRRFRQLKAVSLLLGVAAAALVIKTFISSLGGFGVEEVSSYSDYYVNAAMYYQRHLSGGLPLFHGEIFLSDLWGLAPRALVPDKPHVYGIIKIIDIFYPGAADGGYTPAFATVGYYADFGWLGVICSGLFNPGYLLTAGLYASLLPRLQAFNIGKRNPHSTALLYAFVLMAAPSFLVFFDFPLDFLTFGILIGFTELVNRVRFVSMSAPSSGALPGQEQTAILAGEGAPVSAATRRY